MSNAYKSCQVGRQLVGTDSWMGMMGQNRRSLLGIYICSTCFLISMSIKVIPKMMPLYGQVRHWIQSNKNQVRIWPSGLRITPMALYTNSRDLLSDLSSTRTAVELHGFTLGACKGRCSTRMGLFARRTKYDQEQGVQACRESALAACLSLHQAMQGLQNGHLYCLSCPVIFSSCFMAQRPVAKEMQLTHPSPNSL